MIIRVKLSNAEKCTKYANMRNRCYNEAWQDENGRHYKGHTVCKEWLDNKQKFYDWVDDRYYIVPFDTVDLDHNVVDLNNKIYSPDKCLFVPHEINAFFETLNARQQIKRLSDGTYKVSVTSTIWKDNPSLKVFDMMLENFLFDSWNHALTAFCLKKKLIKELYLEKYRGRIPGEVFDAIDRANIFKINANLFHWDEYGAPSYIAGVDCNKLKEESRKVS